MEQALAAQRGRDLRRAANLYREALALAPDDPDALHMLGVVCYDLHDDAQARQLILRALDLTDWRHLAFRHNLGLVIARQVGGGDDARLARLRARYREWRSGVSASAVTVPPPKIAVVVPCYNHSAFVERSLRSVFTQTYRELELIVIDDGSADATAAVARRVLEDCPFPSRFLARANRGAPATINEGVGQSDAAYINVLNSDDEFTPDRLSVLVEAIASRGLAWGFAAVDVVDIDGRPADPLRELRALTLLVRQGSIELEETVGFSLITHNTAVSTGNLFFSRPLFDAIGGFRDFRCNHDWDFCLRALPHAEPLFVPQTGYRYRLHSGNTIVSAGADARAEANRIFGDYFTWAASGEACSSPWAPCFMNWGVEFLTVVLEAGMAEAFDPAQLRNIVRRFEMLPTGCSDAAAMGAVTAKID